jgi:hypothetical protein
MAKQLFTIILVDAGDRPIEVIKEIRGISGAGLREAKDIIEDPPQRLRKSLSRREADKIKRRLEGAGATVSLIREDECVILHVDAGDRTFEVIEELSNIKFRDEVPSQPITISTERNNVADFIRQLENAGAAVRIETVN